MSRYDGIMNIKTFNLILIIYLTYSCGPNTFDNGVEIIDYERFIVNKTNRCEQCENYQDQFIKEMNVKNPPMKIGFANLDSNRLGVCYLYKDARPAFIKIDRAKWATLTDNIRKALIYHELGHCLLKLGHINDYGILRDKEYEMSHLIKLSIMNPSIMNEFQAAYTIYEWQNYLISLQRAVSIKQTENINFKEIREIYYSDIRKWEKDKRSYIINEKLIFPYICLQDKIVYRDETLRDQLKDEGFECNF